MHQGELLTAGEHPLAHLARVGVDPAANVWEKLGCILNFIDDGGRGQLVEERAGVCAHAGQDVWVLQEGVACLGQEAAENGGFASTAGAGEHHRRECCEDPPEVIFDLSRKEAHVRSLKYNVKKLKGIDDRCAIH